MRKVDPHRFRRDLIVTDRLERAAVGRIDQHDDDRDGNRRNQHRDKENAYNRLADIVADSLDMEKLAAIMDGGDTLR